MDRWKLILEAITAIGALLSFGAVIVAIFALKDAQKWNRMSSVFRHLPQTKELNELEIELNATVVRLIDRTSPITDREIADIDQPGNERTRVVLKNYLNMLEGYCTAINFGMVDNEVAKAVYGYKFRRHFEEMEPYIKHLRTLRNNESLWCELQETVTHWKQNKAPRKRY